jgi:hypothetical protein
VENTLLPTPEDGSFWEMSITAKVHNGAVILPSALHLPDGTEVEVIIPAVTPHHDPRTEPVHLPTFHGDGLMPGIDLEDRQAIRRQCDEPGKRSQMS